MRKRGTRIIDKRLKFKKGFQRQFIGKIKKESGLSWSKLAYLYKISERTLKWDFYTEKTTLPLKFVQKLIKRYPFEDFKKIQTKWVEEILEPNWGQKIAGEKNLKKIKFPEISELLAELFGILLGDGHINNKGIRVTGNILEKYHYLYIKEIIKKLFGLESRIYTSYTNKNTIILNVYSTKLVNFLTREGLTLGNKIKNNASFPKWIFTDEKYIFAALRGLLDTDGGIYLKQKDYKRIFLEFQTNSKKISEDIINLLKKVGFSPSKRDSRGAFNIRVQNQNEVHAFFKKAGSSNPKNIIRYNEFMSNETIPLKESLVDKIVAYQGKIPFKTQP